MRFIIAVSLVLIGLQHITCEERQISIGLPVVPIGRNRCCSRNFKVTNDLASGGTATIASPNNPMPYGTQVNNVEWKIKCATSRFTITCPDFDVRSTTGCRQDALRFQTCSGNNAKSFCGSSFATLTYNSPRLCISFTNALNTASGNTGFSCTVACTA